MSRTASFDALAITPKSTVTSKIRISLDAMGGDNAPDSVVSGAAIALARRPGVAYLFFGDEAKLKPLLATKPSLAAVSEIHHTTHVVGSADKPSVALRQGRQSSMRLAINAVKDGIADGVVSAGNTGALMAMSKFVLKMLPGIDRPAICTSVPKLDGKTVMLDLGANIECDKDNLIQFAFMGAAFARTELGLERPKVGILNVGEEEIKGHDEVRAAAEELKGADFSFDFVGFVEGDDIAKGTVDVVVTDGFTGNIALKTMEGTASLYGEFIQHAFSSSLWAKITYLLIRPVLSNLRQQVDPRSYNGAVLIGLNGISVKSHGGMDDIGFSYAIDVAIDLIADNVTDRIIEDFNKFGDVTRAAE